MQLRDYQIAAGRLTDFVDADEEFRRRDGAYYASPERAALQVDPAQWIVDVRHVFLRPVAEGST